MKSDGDLPLDKRLSQQLGTCYPGQRVDHLGVMMEPGLWTLYVLPAQGLGFLLFK